MGEKGKDSDHTVFCNGHIFDTYTCMCWAQSMDLRNPRIAESVDSHFVLPIHGLTHDCAIPGLHTHDEREGPLLAGAIKQWSLTSYVVLDCKAKDGIESTNSKPTLLEDQRKNAKISPWMNEAFYHATS